MIISFEINADEEQCYREAGVISGESFGEMAKDGAWMRINDIIRESKRDTLASRTSKVMRFCANCMRCGNTCDSEMRAHCKKTPSRIHFVPRRTSPYKNTKHTDPKTITRMTHSHIGDAE